ncbi:hypothetical protein [Ferviditalea candida]|uniref:Copper amine oxidase-like N-terminal domain-containing protein n=1 Tax=Ferviditalea candida TaxID=3108399 RepID=A0ABU5ZKC6_9BACL|nr:hypothetical protein [Paenibacillaceae bacterium T2]
MLNKFVKFMVPVLIAVFSFAAGVYASGESEKVTAFLRNDYHVKVDGREAAAAKVLVYNNESYLPVRTIGELLGNEILWGSETKSILIGSRPAPTGRVPASCTDSQQGTNAGSGSVQTGPITGNPNYPAEIKFSSVIEYLVQLNGIKHEILANSYNGVLYFRYADLVSLGIDLNGVSVTTEQYTKDYYVPSDELRDRLKNPEKFEPMSEPIIRETDQEKIDALKVMTSTTGIKVHDIRPIEGTNEYECLWEENSHFYAYRVKLIQKTDGTWGVGGFQTIDIYP